jgi:DNA segregation ATPase FtsK/SpoIIIE-like protein
MSERKSLSGGDWLAIGAFLAGTLVAVLMAYGLLTGVDSSAGTGALAATIAGSLGPWPALIGGVGIALLGARGFLTGERGGLLSGVMGVLGVAAGLAVVAGSLSAVRGGSLGAATGGRVAEMTHPAVGILLGAIVAFGAAYFAWMREDLTAAAKLAPARRATPAPPKGDDGVTAAESAMLFPIEHAAVEVGGDEPVALAPARKALYPEDVRLKGQIPAGTAPLATPNGSAAGVAIPATPEPAVYRWTAPRAAAPRPLSIAQREIEALADVAPPIPEPIEVFEEIAEEIAEEAEIAPLPPRPSWESTGLAEDDEPVDAYGTPISLVERARLDREPEVESAPDTDDEPIVAAVRIPREIGDEDRGDEPAEDATVLGIESEAVEPEPEIVVVAEEVEVAVVAAVEPAVTGGEDEESLLEVLRAHNAAVRAEAEAAVEDEVVEDELAEDEVAETEVVAEVAPEELEQEELPEEELVAEVEVVAVLAEDEVDEDSDEDLESALDDDDLADDEPQAELEPEPAVEPAVDITPTRAKPVAAAAPGLFDSVESEPELVLRPQAAVPASRAEKAPARGIDPEKKLLVEVGCMFVERGRVAVSMLQRQYDMDFDQACRVLDDLQEMGLIGPYMGGKNRDILLSKDQWMEKVGAA